MTNSQPKLIVILGPTAVGKTRLAVRLAYHFGGEIISADSRQVYRGMDLGTGKDLADYYIKGKKIPYHLIDVIAPNTVFNAAKYQKLAYRAIDDVLSRGKLPFLVGGTGLYLDAVIRGYQFSVPEQKISAVEFQRLRKKLDQLTLAQLLARLKKIDLISYRKIDQKNRRRVQRALEIFYSTGQIKSAVYKMASPGYDLLILGVKHPLKKIYQKIDRRLVERLNSGLIAEVRKLHRKGVSWKRLEEFGLEYRYIARYWRGVLAYEELLKQLPAAIHHFAKRQLTWFKRNPDIRWLKSYPVAVREIKKFLQK